MKLFKSVDEKFEEIGFKKVEGNKYSVYYERYIEKYDYTHCLDILYRPSGNYVIRSCQKDINKDGSCNMVCLSMYEAKLALKKMRQMGYKYKR